MRCLVQEYARLNGMGHLLMHLVVDFEHCVQLPDYGEKSTMKKRTEPGAMESFQRQFRIASLTHAQFQSRVAPLRRNAVYQFPEVCS